MVYNTRNHHMAGLEKLLESKMVIRFHDCDPYNHLNNSKYIDYIVTARGDQLLKHYNFDMYALAQQQEVCWVSAQTQISYVSPALPMEVVVIQTQLISCTEKSLHIEGMMWDDSKTQLKAVLWTKFVHFNIKNQKSQQHSEYLMNLFKSIVNPLPVHVTFEERVQLLKKINCSS